MANVTVLKVHELDEVEVVRCEDLASCLINYEAYRNSHKEPELDMR